MSLMGVFIAMRIRMGVEKNTVLTTASLREADEGIF